MKRICALLLAAGLFVGYGSQADAVEFTAKGQWCFAFGVGDTAMTANTTNAAGHKSKGSKEDTFATRQRIFLFLTATASENLYGMVQFHIGPQQWGKSRQGGALGTDGTVVKVRQAYIDWLMPSTDLRVRAGMQTFAMPNAAGGSAVFDTRTPAITTNYKINDNVSATALWMRPFNDNFVNNTYNSSDQSGYLDNMDLFSLMLPITGEGVRATPWVMYGMKGRNSMKYSGIMNNDLEDGYPAATLTPFLNKLEGSSGLNASNFGTTSKNYGSMFWAGLPLKVSSFDPLNIEFDINYGAVESMGRYDVARNGNSADTRRGNSQRAGWLAKALVEYKIDWGTPGLFAWYASGDDGNVKNGSERMPSLCPYGDFTSFLGDGNLHWGPGLSYFDRSVSYAGTWGLGAQVKDVNTFNDLKHTLRVAYWGGTNSPAMVKYMDTSYAWEGPSTRMDGPYLTTNDGMLECNIISEYKIYENLKANLEVGYVANLIDDGTWKRSAPGFGSYSKQDIWKAQLLLSYDF